MPVSAAALQAQKPRGAALLTVVPLLRRRLAVQIAVDLQHQVLAADQTVQSFPVSAGLPVKTQGLC